MAQAQFKLVGIVLLVGSCLVCCVMGGVINCMEAREVQSAREACHAPSVFRPRAANLAGSNQIANYECVSADQVARERLAAEQQRLAREAAERAEQERQRVAAAERYANIVPNARALATARYTDVLEYDASLERSIAELVALPADYPHATTREVAAAKTALERKRTSIRSRVERAHEEERARAAMDAICGSEPPVLSPFDGELVGAERYVARSAHDPDSIDVENCTVPQRTRDICWVTTCQVRGKNAFGAMVLNRTRFSVGANNRILGSEPAR